MNRLSWQRGFVVAACALLLVAAVAATALVGGPSAGEAASAPQLRPAALRLAAGAPSSSSTGTSASARARAARAYGRLPLSFEPAAAAGQTRFLARGAGATVLLAPTEAIFSLASGEKSGRPALLRMRLEGASPRARLSASNRLPGVVNELLGDDPSRWRSNVPTFARLQAAEVYPGIDLAFHGRQGSLEYDFLLAPGADPGRIALGFRGQ